MQNLTLSILHFLLFCSSSSKHWLFMKNRARIPCSHLQSFLGIRISCPIFRLSPYDMICHAMMDHFLYMEDPGAQKIPSSLSGRLCSTDGIGGRPGLRSSFITAIISRLASSSSSIPEKHRLLKLKGRQQTREQYLT